MTEAIKREIETIRIEWAENDAKRDANLSVPENIKAFYNISYGPYGDENLLDIYMEKTTSQGMRIPAIVNIHGGGFVYGSKEIYKYYCMSLAQRGFVVVNFNYRLAPENKFPCALEDINQVLCYIEKECDNYSIDKNRLILVGDSAGAQLASHYATIMTNPEFAKLFDFKVPDVKVKALGLNCGTYDGRKMILSPKDIDGLFVEAYLGILMEENYEKILSDQQTLDDLLKKTDLFENITANFPPVFLMSTYTDFFLKNVDPMYELLQSRNVPVVKKIYGSVDRPEIGHVFHVNCNLKEAAECNDDECQFFRKYL